MTAPPNVAVVLALVVKTLQFRVVLAVTTNAGPATVPDTVMEFKATLAKFVVFAVNVTLAPAIVRVFAVNVTLLPEKLVFADVMLVTGPAAVVFPAKVVAVDVT